MTFEYTDADRTALRVLPSSSDDVLVAIGSRRQEPRVVSVRIPADRVEEVVAGIRDAARTAARTCNCPHPVDEHSIYGCADDCACEWMPKRAARQTTGQDDTEAAPVGRCTVMFQGGGRCEKRADHRPPGSDDPHTPEPAPAVGRPAEAHDTEARPPRVQWRVEGYDADVWLPVSRAFATSADAHARKRVSRRYPDMPTRVVRETTTWTVEGER